MIPLLLGVLLIPAFALAEPVEVDKKVVCDDATLMLPYIKEKYNEDPIWFGNINNKTDAKMVITVNQETQSWSVIQYSLKDNISCLVEGGQGFKFKLPNML